MALFDRFTEKGLHVLNLADDETRRLGQMEIATVQLLLGLIREKTGVAAQVLQGAGISLENARREVEKIQGRGQGTRGEISFNQHTRQVFEFSSAEGERLKDSEIDTQHLLLGLLKQSQGGAIKVLQNLGVDPNQLRTEVFRKLAAQGHPTASEFLPVPIPTNSDETTRIKSQLDLIREVMENPEGSSAEFLKAHSGLINNALIEGVASILEQQGNTKGAEDLRGLLAPVSEEKENVETTDNLPEAPVNLSESVQVSTPPEEEVIESESIELSPPPEVIGLISTPSKAQVAESESIEVGEPPVALGLISTLSEAAIAESESIEVSAPPVALGLISTPSEAAIAESESIEVGEPPVALGLISTPSEAAIAESESIEVAAPPVVMEPVVNVPIPSIEDIEKFLYGLLRVTFESPDDEEVGYGFLRENLENLSDRFSEVFQNWADNTLPRLGDSQKQELLKRITFISSLIRKFDGGVRGTNLEIALTGYSIVASLITQVEAPENWAIIHYCLGLTYLERVKGERVENLKRAIDCFIIALGFYNREEFPIHRKIVIENVKKVVTELNNLPEEEEQQEINPQNLGRSQKYLFLIEQLLRSPQSQQESILDDNYELLDAGLIEMMRERAEAEKNMGNIQNAELLNSIAEQLTETLSSLPPSSLPASSDTLESHNNDSETTAIPEKHQSLNDTENTESSAPNAKQNAQMELLLKIFEILETTNADIQLLHSLHSLIQENLEKLDSKFAQALRNKAIPALADAEPKQAQNIAANINNFGELLIQQFQLMNTVTLNASTILEIAQTSFEIAATVFTEVEFPEQSTQIQNRLCLTFLFQVCAWVGESQGNLQFVYSLLVANQDKLNDRFIRFLRDWGTAQLFLSGNQIFTIQKKAFQGFAEAFFVFGSLMQEFSEGNKEINQEISITCYEVAITFLSQSDFPAMRARIQSVLGSIYCDRIRGDSLENLKLAQQYLQAALEVFAAPQQRIQLQEELDRVIRKVQQLEKKSSNTEIVNNSDGGEILESDVNQEFQKVKTFDDKKKPIEPIPSTPTDTEKIQDVEIVSNIEAGGEEFNSETSENSDFIMSSSDFNKFFWRCLMDDMPELTELDGCNEEEISSLMELFLNNEDSNEIVKKMMEHIEDEAVTKMMEHIGDKEDDRELTELIKLESILKSFQTENHPFVASFEKNPEFRAIVIPFLVKVLQESSTILEAKGKQDFAEIIKDLIVEIKTGEIFAELPSNSDYKNANLAYDSLKNDDIIELFGDLDFQELSESFVVELAAIASNIDTDDCELTVPMIQQKFMELLMKRIWILPKFVNRNSKFSNNNGIDDFIKKTGKSSPLGTYFEEYGNFWMEVFETIAQSDGNLQEFVYPILSANLDKLNDFSAWVIENLIKSGYSSPDSDDAFELAFYSDQLTALLLEFPHGNKADKIEIAIAYNLAALEVIKAEVYPQEWALIQTELGPCYHNRVKGDPAENLEKAIKCYNTVIDFFSQPKEKSLYFWAVNKIHLGKAYQQRIWGNIDENRETALKAYQEVLNVPELKTEEPKLWALAQWHLGMAYIQGTQNVITLDEQEKNLEDAISCFQNASTIFTQENFPEYWANCQTGLAFANQIKHQRGKTDGAEAISIYQHLLQNVFTRKAFPERWGMINLGLGEIYREAKNWEQAINCFQNALQVLKRTTDTQNYVKVIGSLGCIYLETQDFYNAYSNLALAINTAESLHNTIISGDKIKEKFSEGYGLFYQFIIKACLELATTNPDYYNKAIEYLERSKSRSLVELLTSSNIKPKGNIPEDTLKKLESLRQEIANEQRRLSKIGNQLEAEDEAKDYLEQYNISVESTSPDYTRLNELQKEFDNLVDNEIYYFDPNFSFTQKVNPISFSDIKNILPDNQTAIIEWYIPLPVEALIAAGRAEKASLYDKYFIGDEGNTIYTFITTLEKEHPVVLQTPIERYLDLWESLSEYFQTHYEPQKLISMMITKLKKVAEALEIDRIVSHLSNVNKVILIPHKTLHLLPLHALPLKDGSCLLDRFSKGISYAPNCQILQLRQDKLQDNSHNFLAIQNPTGDLKYTDLEVQTIQQYFQPQSQVLPGEQATKEAFINLPLNKINYLHLSCHGYFNTVIPLLSGLLLANSDVSELSISKCLTLEDIFNLYLKKCKLVVLSACETGVTSLNVTVDEYIGLPSGFLYAGASNVVSSLWTVDDISTAFLMIKFYQNLKSDLTVALALNQAQLWLRDATTAELQKWVSELKLEGELVEQIQDELEDFGSDEKPYQEPFYWAAFCAVGK